MIIVTKKWWRQDVLGLGNERLEKLGDRTIVKAVGIKLAAVVIVATVTVAIIAVVAIIMIRAATRFELC